MAGVLCLCAVALACAAATAQPFDSATARAFSVYTTTGASAASYESAVSRLFTVQVAPPITGTGYASAADRAFNVFVGANAQGEAPIQAAVSRAFTVFAGDPAEVMGIRSAAARSFSVYVPQPDLEVTQFHLTGVVEPGKSFELGWGVRNSGQKEASQGWNDCFFLTTNVNTLSNRIPLACEANVRSLPIGEGYLSQTTITLPDNVPNGIYWLVLQADGDEAIGEDNETNNYTSYGPFAINKEGEPVRILPQLDTIYVSRDGGDDDTGFGTEELPLRRVAYAIAHAATYASALRPVRVQLSQGTYDDAFELPPHVRLFGANPWNPGETVIRPTGATLKGNGGVGIVISGEGQSTLRDLTLQFDDSAKGLENATLLLVDNASATIDNVVFDGNGVGGATGMAALSAGSSETTVTRSEFVGLSAGIEVGDSALNISRNIFDNILGDAIRVTSGNKGTGEALTPTLGSEDSQGSTGYNYFGDVSGLLVNNESGSEVKAEMNDWGRYTDEEIAVAMGGQVDFTPYLKQSYFAASVFVAVTNDSNGGPLFNARVQLSPGAWPEVSANEDGVYTLALVTPGQYTIHAEAPGYYPKDTVLLVDNPVEQATLSLQPDGTGGAQVPSVHNGDTNGNAKLDLSEILRGIQFYNAAGLRCMAGTEDGYAPGKGDTSTCPPHVGDYNPINWSLSLSEVLRLVQIYNLEHYQRCDDGEDGYCPGL